MTTQDQRTLAQAARMLRLEASVLRKVHTDRADGEWERDDHANGAKRMHDRLVVTAAALEKMAAG